MMMKVYEGKNIKETLDRVKTELGHDAIILNVEKSNNKKTLGFLGKSVWKVTAAIDKNNKHGKLRNEKSDFNVDSVNRLLSFNTLKLEKIENEFVEMKKMFSQAINTDDNGLKENGRKIYEYLIEREITKENAFSLIEGLEKEINSEKIEDMDFILKYLTIKVSEIIKTKKPFDIKLHFDEPQILTLVGPTGVGKTTTIAKLAANFLLGNKKKVGLITLDTYRICGFEQLKSFGDLIGLEVMPVLNYNEFKEAVAFNKDKDIILVDTVGRSAYDTEEILSLKSIISRHKMFKSLVLNANLSFNEMKNTFKNYSVLGLDDIILSKLDEAGSLGNMYNLLAESEFPLSYVTCGQKVPEDIFEADSLKLAEKVIKNC